MKKLSAEKLLPAILTFLIVLFISGCDSTEIPGYPVFEQAKTSEPVIGMIKGTVNYAAGFYLPTEQSTMDISLIMVNSAGMDETELSHQRIRNVQRFPFQFSIYFDENELADNMQYKILIRFTNDGKTYLTAQSQSVPSYPPDNTVLTLN